MFATDVAKFLGRLALILVFLLALAGCGDDAGDTDAHMDEHDHEGEEHEAGVIASFDDHDGFMKGESANFSQSLKVASSGRFGLVLQRSGHLAANDPFLSDNRIYIVDSGLEVEEHGDHFDPVTVAPMLLPYQLGHGGMGEDEEGHYNPVHFVSHYGLTAIFYDGINPARSSDPAATMQPGFAVVYRDSDFEDKDRTEPPHPVFRLNVGSYSHGAAVAAHDKLIIVTVAEMDGSLPNGVEIWEGHDHGDHVDFELVPDDDKVFAEGCPRLHGEAIWGPYVAFGCVANGDERYLDADGNPLVAEGILVLTALDEHGEVAESIKYADSFSATVVEYPLEYTSGGLAAALEHDLGHDDVIFMARYGPHSQDFLKITEHDIEAGSIPEDQFLEVPVSMDNTDRHRAYAFEPVEGSAGRLLVQDQDADGDNYHLDVVELGDMDHDMEGGGHFVVLTATGDLHIFDLSSSDMPEIVDLDAACLGELCPSLALAPGFAYVSDPAGGRVIEVHLAAHHVEREFEEDLTTPTQIVVLGRYGYELEHAHAR